MQWLVSEARTWDATGSNPCRYFFFSCTSPAPVHIGTRLQSKIMGSYSLAAANQSATGHLKQISVSKTVMFFYGNKRDSMDVLSERRGVRDRSRKKRGSGKTMRGKGCTYSLGPGRELPSRPRLPASLSPRAESSCREPSQPTVSGSHAQHQGFATNKVGFSSYSPSQKVASDQKPSDA